MISAPHGKAQFYKGKDEIYRCAAFEQFEWLEHGFGTRASAPADVTTLRQTHSARVVNAHKLCDRAEEGDALVSVEAGKRIGIRTADCVPILLADARNRAVAAVHAGWRGSAASIVRHAVERMASEFSSGPNDIHAAIGPAILVCCYEVGAEVAAHFEGLFPERVTLNTERVMLDLQEANRRVLASAGVPERQIYTSGLCTSCRLDEFYSYRREPQNSGRMLSYIARTE